MWHALASGDEARVHSAVFGLVGLGPGLTPSGDDLLCGLLAGLQVLAAREWRGEAQPDNGNGRGFSSVSRGQGPRSTSLLYDGHPFDTNGVEALRNSVLEAVRRTTALSATMLRYAAGDGVASAAGAGIVAVQPLLDVLWSLGAPGGVRGLEGLLAIGHSSGSDMLTGALLAASLRLARHSRALHPKRGRARHPGLQLIAGATADCL
jgi:hypothetical protein